MKTIVARKTRKNLIYLIIFVKFQSYIKLNERKVNVRIKVKAPKNYERELEILLGKDEITPYFDKKYTEFKETTNLGGFRKGKVPLDLIRKMFSKKVNALVLGEIIEEFYTKAIEKKKLDPVNKARIDVVEYEPEEMVKFKATFEIEPEFEVTGIEEIKLKKEIFKPTESDVEKELERIQLQHGTTKNSEGPVENGDYVVMDIQEVDPKTGVQIIGKKHDDITARIGSDELEKDISEKLIGAKVNDTIDITRELDTVMTKKEGEKIKERLLARVKKIDKVEVSPLDDEFVKNLKGDFKDLEDFKSKLRESLELTYKNQSERMFNNLLKDELVKKISPEAPPSMTDFFLSQMIEDEKKKGQMNIDESHYRDMNRSRAEWNIKWYLIKKKLIEQEKITVEDDEMYKRLEIISQLQNIDFPQLKRDYRINKDKYNWLKDEMLENKMLDVIKEKIEIEDV